MTGLLHWENFHFELCTWYKPFFYMNLIRFSNYPFLPKIMKILLSKYMVKICPWLSQHCKRFCTRNFFILKSTSEKSIYLTCIWYLFFRLMHFYQNSLLMLFKYWLKTWGPSCSQYCKRFWLDNHFWKVFILNRTPEISLILNLIRFLNDPLLPKRMKKLLIKFWLKSWCPSMFQYCNTWLNILGIFFILNHTTAIRLFLT